MGVTTARKGWVFDGHQVSPIRRGTKSAVDEPADRQLADRPAVGQCWRFDDFMRFACRYAKPARPKSGWVVSRMEIKCWQTAGEGHRSICVDLRAFAFICVSTFFSRRHNALAITGIICV